MTLPVTAFYAALLTLIYIVLVQLVIRTRLQVKVGLGENGNDAVLQAVRRQGNFVENVPLAIVLMALAEAGGSGALLLNLCGIVLVAARLIHPFGIDVGRPSHPARILGAVATTAVLLVLAVTLILQRLI
ncbi:MAG: MAPEG family protein [Pseudorhodobacter sp.]|nr:MAPEG family protein [Pseudorhodobacter sp.]